MLSKSSNFQAIAYLHQHGAIIEKKIKKNIGSKDTSN
jgi:hypothetical protein